jgi:signal transduction histidine kinase
MPEERDLLKDERVPRVLEHLPIGFMRVHIPQGIDTLQTVHIREVNSEFLRIFNLKKEKCTEHTLEEALPEVASSWVALAKKSFSSAEPVKAGRYVEGIQKYIQAVVFSLHNDIVFLIIDRSKEWISERENKSLQDQLIHSQKMEDIGSLAGGIAHDFNNLITAIHGYAEVALIQNNNSEYQEECLKQILVTAKRAANLTQQLLFFSRKKHMAGNF